MLESSFTRTGPTHLKRKFMDGETFELLIDRWRRSDECSRAYGPMTEESVAVSTPVKGRKIDQLEVPIRAFETNPGLSLQAVTLLLSYHANFVKKDWF